MNFFTRYLLLWVNLWVSKNNSQKRLTRSRSGDKIIKPCEKQNSYHKRSYFENFTDKQYLSRKGQTSTRKRTWNSRTNYWERVLVNSTEIKKIITKETDAKSVESSSNGEFDPGSGWTLAACLIHASRTVSSDTVANGWVTRREPGHDRGIISGNGN